MRKSFLLYVAALMLVVSFIGTSCKKIIHSNAPTPNNVRMLSYTKITSIKMTTPIAGLPSTINENFRFYYDDVNRLSKIVYTGNDSFEIHKDIEFAYKTDTFGKHWIYKKTINILTNVIVEMDSFLLDGDGRVVTAYTPHLITDYAYYGKLLARTKRTGTSYSRITMTDNSTYTSVNGDFLKHNFDGKLHVDFTDFTTPFKVVKYLTPDMVDTERNYQYNSLSMDKDYNYSPVFLYAKDTTGVRDSIYYPGVTWVNEGYHFYTEDANRMGDYMQLESFTFYGQNIFQNSHLVESITARNRNAAISYDIDAFSKITRTKVVVLDSVLNNFTYVYDIQYETY
jgi:hypothetical protein